MIKPAILYKDNILTKYAEVMYDPAYQYYFGYPSSWLPNIPDNTENGHYFVSVDKDNNVIGYITYSINHLSKSCFNFGLISFDRGNITLIRDTYQVVDDIFNKYNFNRIEWNCFADNPAINGYRNFIKRCGGREVGYLKQTNVLMDQKLHDSVLFELMKEEYKPIKRGKDKCIN